MKRQNIFAMIVLSLLMLSLSSCYEQTELPGAEATQADSFDIMTAKRVSSICAALLIREMNMQRRHWNRFSIRRLGRK